MWASDFEILLFQSLFGLVGYVVAAFHAESAKQAAYGATEWALVAGFVFLPYARAIGFPAQLALALIVGLAVFRARTRVSARSGR